MNEIDFRKKVREMLRNLVPNAIRLDSREELLCRVWKNEIRKPGSTVLTSNISKGIKCAGKYLKEMSDLGLLELTPGGNVSFVVDGARTSGTARGRTQIEALRIRDLAEIEKQMNKDPRTKQIVDETLKAAGEESLAEVIANNKKLKIWNEIIERLKAEKLLDTATFVFGRIDWRTDGNRWSLGRQLRDL